MDRIIRSFQLVGQSYRVLMRDKELLVLPLISGVILTSIVIIFFLGLGFGRDPAAFASRRNDLILPAFLLYVVLNTVGIFFQAAVVAGATERLRGGNPTVGSALEAASRRFGAILLWAVVAATVGVVLQIIRDRSGILGRIITSIGSLAWSLATFFIVPVLVLEHLSVRQSFERSVSAFQDTWGESVVGTASVGIVATFAWIALAIAVATLVKADAVVLAIAVGAAGGVLLLTFFSALQAIYVASLYRFATAGEVEAGFDRDLLKDAFVRKDD